MKKWTNRALALLLALSMLLGGVAFAEDTAVEQEVESVVEETEILSLLSEETCTHPNATTRTEEWISSADDYAAITRYTHTFYMDTVKITECPDCGDYKRTP